jgi:hypothetical protein
VQRRHLPIVCVVKALYHHGILTWISGMEYWVSISTGFMVTSEGSNFLLGIGKEDLGNIVLHQFDEPIPSMEASDCGLFHGLILVISPLYCEGAGKVGKRNLAKKQSQNVTLRNLSQAKGES